MATDWQRRAERNGWKPSETCSCGRPRPVIVGGDGYYIPPLMCANCRRKVAHGQR